ncbi:MAG: RDD family protein [Deltaproteobacteria bacterium]
MDFQVNPYAAPAEVRGQTGSSPGAPIHIAGRGTRFMAALIDLGMLGFLFGVGCAVTIAVYWPEIDTFIAALKSPRTLAPDANVTQVQVENMRTLKRLIRVVALGSCLPPLLLYSWQCVLVAKSGQSLAKRWLGIRIIRQSGESAGLGHGVVLRSWLMNILILIPFLGYAIGVVDTLFIFRARSRRLRDLLADTIVVKDG